MHVFDKLGRVEVEEATAGDIVAVVGLEEVEIGDTISDPIDRQALPRVEVDQPTLEMIFSVNSSPLAGPRGQVRHQPAPARPADEGTGSERGVARASRSTAATRSPSAAAACCTCRC